MGINHEFSKGFYKALVASGFELPSSGHILVTIADKDKNDALPLIQTLSRLGFNISATRGTALFLEESGLQVERVNKIREGSPHVVDVIYSGKVDLVINTLTRGKMPKTDGFRIRRAAVEYNIPCFTSIDTALAAVKILDELKHGFEELNVLSLQDYLKSRSGSRSLK